MTDCLALLNAIHQAVPDATTEEIFAVVRARPYATVDQLALDIWANRPDDADYDGDDDDD